MCGKTNQECFVNFYLIYVKFEQCLLGRRVNEAIKFVFVQQKIEIIIQKLSVLFLSLVKEYWCKIVSFRDIKMYFTSFC